MNRSKVALVRCETYDPSPVVPCLPPDRDISGERGSHLHARCLLMNGDFIIFLIIL